MKGSLGSNLENGSKPQSYSIGPNLGLNTMIIKIEHDIEAMLKVLEIIKNASPSVIRARTKFVISSFMYAIELGEIRN
jgi:hypothetical protein